MTELTMNYVVNPLAGFWRGLVIHLELLGYARAASELARLGYYEEAKVCIMQAKELEASK